MGDAEDLDGSYLAAIVAGDAQAFGHWMARAEPPLRLQLRSFATVVDVEAVLQESLLRVWQVAPRFRPDGRPNGLLRLAVRISRNLAIDETRRQRRLREVEDQTRAHFAPEPSTVEPAPADPLLRRLIALCREKLPPRPAAALTARLEAAGATADATLAEGLGMRKNTFLQNITRARTLLADCLTSQGWEGTP